MAISMSSWKTSRSSKSVRLGKSYFQTEDYESNNNHRWLMFWRRITRTSKKKKGSSESPLAVQKAYDPKSYSQNFDEGCERVEPDHLYRSFSARYANPSRFFVR